MVACAARDDVHAVDEVELLEVIRSSSSMESAPFTEPSSKRVANDARLLVNLLQHEIGVSALFCHGQGPNRHA